MAGRDRMSIVCRDCGDVSHIHLPSVKPGSLVSCGSCGLVVDPSHLRPPPADVTRALRSSLADPREPRRGGPPSRIRR